MFHSPMQYQTATVNVVQEVTVVIQTVNLIKLMTLGIGTTLITLATNLMKIFHWLRPGNPRYVKFILLFLP
jgi:hypothetical protein